MVESIEYFESNCSTMLEFLRWYNLLDCHLLLKAIEKYANGYLQDWETNIHNFKSVSFSRIFIFILSLYSVFNLQERSPRVDFKALQFLNDLRGLMIGLFVDLIVDPSSVNRPYTFSNYKLF